MCNTVGPRVREISDGGGESDPEPADPPEPRAAWPIMAGGEDESGEDESGGDESVLGAATAAEPASAAGAMHKASACSIIWQERRMIEFPISIGLRVSH